MMHWWLALNSYPHADPQKPVDDATLRTQSLTECQKASLYLKDNLLKIKKINKKIINIKNLMVIPMSILILTLSTTPAKAATQIDLLKLYAHSRLLDYKEFQCFNKIITKESRWSYLARNGSHYGLGQMRSKHYRDLDPFRQIDASIKYITVRYGTSCKAWAFHQQRNYY
jgi:hypothetical protein